MTPRIASRNNSRGRPHSSKPIVAAINGVAVGVGITMVLPMDVLIASDGDSVSVGTPTVAGASVKAEVLRHGKDRKIIVFKRKKRKGYRRKQGHRQKFTEIRVAEIKL